MKLRGALALLVLVVAAPLVAPAPAGSHEVEDPADRQDEIDDQLDRLRSRYDEAEAEEADLLARYELSQQRAAELAARVRQLDVDLVAAGRELRAAKARLARIEARRKAVERRARAVRADLAQATETLRDQAVAAYMGTADGNRLDALLLRAEDARQVLLTTGYATAVAKRQEELIEELDRHAADLAAIERHLAENEDGAERTRNEIRHRAAALESTKQSIVAARAEAAKEASRQAGLLDEVRRRQADYERRIASLQAESDAIAALLRARQAGQGLVPSGNGQLRVPVSGPITSGFGTRVHPIYGTRRMHTGVDFGVSYGTAIRAAASGEVVWASWRGGYGLATVIDHGGSLATLYAHQSSITAVPGEIVSAGEVIGYVGSTGLSTGPHLHFEVRVNGNPVNPMPYL